MAYLQRCAFIMHMLVLLIYFQKSRHCMVGLPLRPSLNAHWSMVMSCFLASCSPSEDTPAVLLRKEFQNYEQEIMKEL